MRQDADGRTPYSMLPRAPRAVTLGSVRAAPGSVPRLNGLYTPKPYRYQGTGEDTLTPQLDDEPAPLPAPVRRTRVQLAMCPPCWDDLCIACQGGPCCCACQDERRPA